jgi:hypothetical protein
MAKTQAYTGAYAVALKACDDLRYSDVTEPSPCLFKRKYADRWIIVLPNGKEVSANDCDSAVFIYNAIWRDVDIIEMLAERLSALRTEEIAERLPANPQPSSLPLAEPPEELPQ